MSQETVIRSSSNHRVKELKRLMSSRGHRRGGLAVLEGPLVIETAAEASVRPVLVCYNPDVAADSAELIQRLAGQGADLMAVTAGVLNDLADTETSRGLMVVVETGELDRVDRWWERAALGTDEPTFVVICDGVQDPGNVGTIIRAAHAAGAGGVALTGSCADAYAPKTVRASAGWVFHLPVIHAGLREISTVVHTAGLQLVASVADGGRAPWSVDFRAPTALFMGSEAHGLDGRFVRRADVGVTIPMRKTESLNVAMSAAVLLYEARRQRAATTGPGGGAGVRTHHSDRR